MMEVKFLDWDSSFFGWPVGRIELENSFDLMELKKLLVRSDKYKVIYVLLNDPDETSMVAMQDIAPLQDLKLTYAKQLVSTEVTPSDHINPYSGTVTDQLIELAFISGKYSRYNVDLRFRPYFKDLYTKWIEQSINGNIANQVYVWDAAGRTAGFVTLSGKPELDRGVIGLLAVHPDFQGQGIASDLMAISERWAMKNSTHEMHVITQSENIPACRLYEKNGYLLIERTAVFHYWNPRV